MRTLTVRSRKVLATWTAWMWAAVWLASPCLSAPPPRMPVPPAARNQPGIQFRAVGDDLAGFILFVAVAVTLAVSYFTSRWLVSAFPGRRPSVIGSIFGTLIGLVAALCLNQFMGWPLMPTWNTLFPNGLCLVFGFFCGRRSAVEEAARLANPAE